MMYSSYAHSKILNKRFRSCPGTGGGPYKETGKRDPGYQNPHISVPEYGKKGPSFIVYFDNHQCLPYASEFKRM